MPINDSIPALKEQLAHVLIERLHGWTQANAAALLDTDQPRISDVRGGRLERFSLEQLIRFTSRLGGTVTLHISWSSRRRWIAARPR